MLFSKLERRPLYAISISLIRHERRLSDYQVLVIPGGFSYGDDIGAGKVLANELKLKLGEDIQQFIIERRFDPGNL